MGSIAIAPDAERHLNRLSGFSAGVLQTQHAHAAGRRQGRGRQPQERRRSHLRQVAGRRADEGQQAAPRNLAGSWPRQSLRRGSEIASHRAGASGNVGQLQSTSAAPSELVCNAEIEGALGPCVETQPRQSGLRELPSGRIYSHTGCFSNGRIYDCWHYPMRWRHDRPWSDLPHVIDCSLHWMKAGSECQKSVPTFNRILPSSNVGNLQSTCTQCIKGSTVYRKGKAENLVHSL